MPNCFIAEDWDCAIHTDCAPHAALRWSSPPEGAKSARMTFMDARTLALVCLAFDADSVCSRARLPRRVGQWIPHRPTSSIQLVAHGPQNFEVMGRAEPHDARRTTHRHTGRLRGAALKLCCAREVDRAFSILDTQLRAASRGSPRAGAEGASRLAIERSGACPGTDPTPKQPEGCLLLLNAQPSPLPEQDSALRELLRETLYEPRAGRHVISIDHALPTN